jgi:hypothetical protein
VAIYTGAKALSRWPINDESTLTVIILFSAIHGSADTTLTQTIATALSVSTVTIVKSSACPQTSTKRLSRL